MHPALFSRRKKAELYQRDVQTDFSVRICDLSGRIMQGEDLTYSVPIPNVLKRFPRAERTGFVIYGNSQAAGRLAVQTAVAPVATNFTGDTGPRMVAGGTGAATSEVASFETDTSFDSNPELGESMATLAMKHFVDLALAEDAIAIADNQCFGSVPAMPGFDLSQLENGSDQFGLVLIPHVQAGFDFSAAATKAYQARVLFWMVGGPESAASMPYDEFVSRNTVNIAQAFDERTRVIDGRRYPAFTLMGQYPRGTSISDGPQRAIWDMCQQHPLMRYVFNSQALDYTDERHWSGVGVAVAAYYFGRATKQLLIEGREPDSLKPSSPRYVNGELRFPFTAPTLPLVIDTTNIGEATQYGAHLRDDSGDIALSTWSVDGSEFVCVPARAPVGNFWAGMGLRYTGRPELFQSCTHNFRESTATTITVDSVAKPTWHWAPAFEMPGVYV